MSDSAIITVVDHDTTINIHLERGGDPVSIGLRLLETGKVLPGSKRESGELPALLLTTIVCAGSRSRGQKQPVRIIADPKTLNHVAFTYEVLASANAVNVKATEHGKNGAKAGNGNVKVLFDGAILGYVAALGVPVPENWEHRWLIEVVSVDQDIYHRLFSATGAQADRLRRLIDALVKAKELKSGAVVPVTAFETRYTVDNLIGQLTDLLGAAAVKRAAATIAGPPANKRKPAGGGTKQKKPAAGKPTK